MYIFQKNTGKSYSKSACYYNHVSQKIVSQNYLDKDCPYINEMPSTNMYFHKCVLMFKNASYDDWKNYFLFA